MPTPKYFSTVGAMSTMLACSAESLRLEISEPGIVW